MSFKVKLSRRNFESWLRGKGRLQVVGFAGDSGTCPIATYLRSKGEWARVDPGFYSQRNGKQVKRVLPKWGVEFVVIVDTQQKDRLKNDITKITAGRALGILTAIK